MPVCVCVYVCLCGTSGGSMIQSATQLIQSLPRQQSSLHCKRTKNLNFPLAEAYLWCTHKSADKACIHAGTYKHMKKLFVLPNK